jgi:hypothetical protein
MRVKLLLLVMLIPAVIWAQNEKRLSVVTGTTQGISFMHKEALSNTNKKTFNTSAGYAYSYFAGITVKSRSGKAFSDILLGYKSYSNGLKGVVDINSSTGFSDRRSVDRFNYITLEYRYSRYIKTIKDYNTFFSAGLQASYILNEKKRIRYNNGDETIRTSGKNISNNFVLFTSPTLILSYGVEFDTGVWRIGKKSRLSLDFTYDMFMTSPSNKYIGTMVNYKLLF